VHGEGDPPLATSALTGATTSLDRAELAALFAIPQERWVEIEETAIVGELRARGLLIGEADDELLRRDAALAEDEWEPAAAVFHFATKLKDVDLGLSDDDEEIARKSDAAAARFVERHGPPPPHFYSLGGPEVVELPFVRGEGSLYDALAARRTARSFDPESPLSQELFALVLYEVFGCRGYSAIHPDVVVLRKASPSGGGLHPVEVYPLIRNVEGLEPGLYHYSVGNHALEPVLDLTQAEAGETISAFTTGQRWFSDAAAGFVLTARFKRNFWKYRRHPKAYATLLLDAAHLSQTLYLVSADLGLRAFFTNLVDAGRIEERLRLDGYSEGALAFCGCGLPASGASPFEPEFTPYVPRETAI
jgi:putative peptide maturation dehydrogenase